MTRRRPASSAACSRSMPSWPAATSALREVSITNTAAWSVAKTHSHHRWPSLPSTSSNTCQLVSSACTCPPGGRRRRSPPPTARSAVRSASAPRPGCRRPHRTHQRPTPGQSGAPAAQHMFLIHQPRQEPGSEQPFAPACRCARNRPAPMKHRLRSAPPRHDPVIFTCQSICSLSSVPRTQQLPAFAQHRCRHLHHTVSVSANHPAARTPPAQLLLRFPFHPQPRPRRRRSPPPFPRAQPPFSASQQQPAQRRHALLQPSTSPSSHLAHPPSPHQPTPPAPPTPPPPPPSTHQHPSPPTHTTHPHHHTITHHQTPPSIPKPPHTNLTSPIPPNHPTINSLPLQKQPLIPLSPLLPLNQVAAALRKTSSRCHSRNSRPGRSARRSGRSMTCPALA